MLLKERHKLLVRAGAGQFVLALVVELLRLVEEFAEIVQSPEAHGFGKRIVEEKRAVAVVDELHEAPVHQFLVENGVAPERNLLRVELLHGIRVEFAAHRIRDGVDHGLHKAVHAFFRRMAEPVVRERNLHVGKSVVAVRWWQY